MIKKFAKYLVRRVLGWQVRRLRRKNKFTLIAVAGSIGKTSTKFAIASVLEQAFRVRFQKGNYNDPVSVPLIFFGLPMPSLFNPLSWIMVFIKSEIMLLKPYPYDVVIVELGTDFPGQIKQFAGYIQADIGVLTAIAPEHMEYFADLAAVAKEELGVTELSNNLLVNTDLCPGEYIASLKSYQSYAINKQADYRMQNLEYHSDGYSFELAYNGKVFLSGSHDLVSESLNYSVLSAAAVGRELGMEASKIEAGIRNITPVSGRMQRLDGINGSIIIDDTYNASPVATEAALNMLYAIQAPHKVAVLGNMNELGDYSGQAHTDIGNHCDPNKIDQLVTIGPDANAYLAKAAKAKGCNVKTFSSPYEAGEYLKGVLRKGSVVLAKGSQNGVFAEEAIKLLLAKPSDDVKLVRQTQKWLAVKRKQFKNK